MSEDRLIAAEHTFSLKQRDLLRLIVADMIPPSKEFAVPGADDPLIFADILSAARSAETAVAECLEIADGIARECSGESLVDLDADGRTQVFAAIRKLPAMFLLVSLTLQCYYRDTRVMQSLGMEARPPFPGGYEVEAGDWSLLDPVRARKPFYR